MRSSELRFAPCPPPFIQAHLRIKLRKHAPACCVACFVILRRSSLAIVGLKAYSVKDFVKQTRRLFGDSFVMISFEDRMCTEVAPVFQPPERGRLQR
jgi:hypothetical protein